MQSFQSSFTLDRHPAPSSRHLFVTFELRNTHPTQTFYVCHYFTPLESLVSSGAVEITHVDSNTVVGYAGVMCKRVAPQPESYLKVDPGCTITNTIDLREGYFIDIGRYRVNIGSGCKQLNTRLDPNDQSTSQRVDLECEPLEFDMPNFQ